MIYRKLIHLISLTKIDLDVSMIHKKSSCNLTFTFVRDYTQELHTVVSTHYHVTYTPPSSTLIPNSLLPVVKFFTNEKWWCYRMMNKNVPTLFYKWMLCSKIMSWWELNVLNLVHDTVSKKIGCRKIDWDSH